MGVNEEKISLLRAMMLQAEVGKTTITLTREEWQRVEQMSMWIANAVAQAIEHQPYVSQNVLEHAVARVVAMVLKLNVDMFGKAGGWLAQMGFHDFAGSCAVHMVGGVAALVGAKILGPRIGKYTKSGKSKAIPGHNLTIGALGVFILWFCW